MGDRRFEFRIITNDPVEVRWEESGNGKVLEGQFCDRSLSGARIQLERAIRVLTPIRLRTGGEDLKGTVRYCTRVQTRYMLGIEFET